MTKHRDDVATRVNIARLAMCDRTAYDHSRMDPEHRVLDQLDGPLLELAFPPDDIGVSLVPSTTAERSQPLVNLLLARKAGA